MVTVTTRRRTMWVMGPTVQDTEILEITITANRTRMSHTATECGGAAHGISPLHRTISMVVRRGRTTGSPGENSDT